MAGWSKLFSSIVTSSIWCEDDATLRVFIAMLAVCDHDGQVEGSIPGFASLARVTVDQMRRAVEVLSGPDPESRTPDHDGRRIAPFPGGWRILNYRLYRDRAQTKDGSRAPHQRAYRERHRNDTSHGVTRDAEARGERKETETDSRASARGSDSALVFDYWLTRSGTKPRSDKVRQDVLKRITARLREGFTADDLKACVDFALTDEFYVRQGYAKDPSVFWRNSERVTKLSGSAPGAEPETPAPARVGPTAAELDAIDAEGDALAARGSK